MKKRFQSWLALLLEIFPAIYFLLGVFVLFKFTALLYIDIGDNIIDWFFSPFSLFCFSLYFFFSFKVLMAYIIYLDE